MTSERQEKEKLGKAIQFDRGDDFNYLYYLCKNVAYWFLSFVI